MKIGTKTILKEMLHLVMAEIADIVNFQIGVASRNIHVPEHFVTS